MNGSIESQLLDIFRAYDIRGVVPDQLNEKTAFRLGQAFGSSIEEDKGVCVGRDVRGSSKMIFTSFCKGVISTGVDVIDLGKVPSPVLYFNTLNLNLSGGAIITASHLPSNWNGVKFCDNKGIVVSDGTGLEIIKKSVSSKPRKPKKIGKIILYTNGVDEYVNFLISKVTIENPPKIVFDFGNSVTANIVPNIMEKLKIKFSMINADQGKQIRPSELTSYSLKGLKDEVLKTESDIGIAYDGDGDRVGFVDDVGNIYPKGEKIIQIFAGSILEEKKAKIVIDVTCSTSVSKYIIDMGGEPIIIRVGHSYSANSVLNLGAMFGAQYSGHYSFPEMNCIDDAIFASFKMIEILSKSKKTLHSLADHLPLSYASEVLEIECDDKKKFLIIENIARKVKELGYLSEQVDGVKFFSNEHKSNWVLIRASNTSPIIRVNADGETKEIVKQLLDQGITLVKEAMEK